MEIDISDTFVKDKEAGYRAQKTVDNDCTDNQDS
jgi:hypothetical protein